MFLLSKRMGRLADRFGPRLFMGLGPLLAAVGLALMLRLGAHVNYFTDLFPALLVFSLGLASTVAPLTAAVLSDAEEGNAGIASGVNNAIARVAGLIAIAGIGAVISGQFKSSLDKLVAGAPLSPAARAAVAQARQQTLARVDPARGGRGGGARRPVRLGPGVPRRDRNLGGPRRDRWADWTGRNRQPAARGALRGLSGRSAGRAAARRRPRRDARRPRAIDLNQTRSSGGRGAGPGVPRSGTPNGIGASRFHIGASRFHVPLAVDGPRLIAVHPHLPSPRRDRAGFAEVVGAPPLELDHAQAADATEDRRDPPVRPADRVLDLGEGARPVGRLGQAVQELAHEVAAAVVEARNLAGVDHRVRRRVLRCRHVLGMYPHGSIRPCRDDERAVILGMINLAAEAYRGVIPADCWHEPYMPAEELAQELAAGVAFWGYEADTELVGVMGIQPVRDVELIRHAYVLPAHQRLGIGAALLQHLMDLDAAAGSQARRMLVGTWAAAEWAIRFYERHGFELVPAEQTPALLRAYWTISDRQIETSVVLARPPAT